MNKRKCSEREACFLACLLPLLGANTIQVLITCHHSIDRAWWPVMLGVMAVASMAYSGMATALGHICRSCNPAVMWRHAFILGLILVAETMVFFTMQPDWLAVNQGVVQLTPLQRVVHGGGLPWGTYLVSYIVLAIRLVPLSR